MKHHHVTEDSNQHNCTVERHNNITIPLNWHNTLTFPQNITDSGEVTSGPTRHLPPGPASFWLLVSRRTWVALVCATQRHVVLCRYSEHCPNVGHLSILRKCLVRPLSPTALWESWGRSHLWKQRCGNIRIHAHHINFTQRVPPAGVTQYDFVPKRQVAEGWEWP